MATVGMIGLGQIGLPLAQSLIAAGHSVVGYRRGDKSELVALGGIAGNTARAVAEKCHIILSCLPDAAALEAVVSGQDGIASGPCNGRVVVELSTVAVEAKERQAAALQARGARMLDGAISGVPRMVRERQGVIYISGALDDYQTVKPVLDAVSFKVLHFGAFGNATKAKLTTNMLVGLHILAAAEAMVFGLKAGLPADLLVDAIKDGAGSSLQFRVRAPVMAARTWDTVMGSTSMLMKDLKLISEVGERLGCPLPLHTAAERIYQAAMQSGYAETDVASVFAIVAERAGITAQQSG